eukprot:TRINITY_DN25964_c0_g2_i1.p1 TRINITY_DN25964_c0_g2~~TRINITY_DN25964_c0_g2_i1.p1  ORF type:complete len:194 (-),score=42.19 TRINITY_DN25964_c0_g2_i1:7-588(-)
MCIRDRCAAEPPAPTLPELPLGDTATAWAAAGFAVHRTGSGEQGVVCLPSLAVVLTGTGGGLSKVVLSVPGTRAPRSTVLHNLRIDTVPQSKHTRCAAHPNSCQSIGELTLYAHDLQGLVRALAQAGVVTVGGKPPRAMPGGAHAVARYMLGHGAQGQLRLLVFGAVEPSTSCLLYTSPSPRDRTRSRMPSSA